MSTTSKRVTITFSLDEFANLEQAAKDQEMAVAVLIRERLDQWQQMQAGLASASEHSNAELEARLNALETLLQPLERRLQRLDQHCLTIQEGNAVLLSESREQHFEMASQLQQLLHEDIPATSSMDAVLLKGHFARLECYLAAIHKHIEQIGLDVAPPDANQQANNQYLHDQLKQYLERTGIAEFAFQDAPDLSHRN